MLMFCATVYITSYISAARKTCHKFIIIQIYNNAYLQCASFVIKVARLSPARAFGVLKKTLYARNRSSCLAHTRRAHIIIIRLLGTSAASISIRKMCIGKQPIYRSGTRWCVPIPTKIDKDNNNLDVGANQLRPDWIHKLPRKNQHHCPSLRHAY